MCGAGSERDPSLLFFGAVMGEVREGETQMMIADNYTAVPFC